MAKVMPSAIVTVNQLEFTGNLTTEEAQEAVKNYFNTLNDTSFSKSDLVSLLQQNGANFVDLNMDIEIKQYRTDFTYSVYHMDGQVYSMPLNTVSRFYTELDNLTGVLHV
jgi:predicted ATPase